jgi:hypothetical protein
LQVHGVVLGFRLHDFIDKELGKAIAYGVYDIGAQPQRSFHPEWNYTITPRSPKPPK